MATSDKSTALAPSSESTVSCDVCLKEVPFSEATVPEAAEYFVHFCGLECYEKWKKQRQESEQQGGPAPA